MKVFAIADPHLSFGRPKPMDIFGERWREHPRQIAREWDRRVGDGDVVLVAGDISWARSAAEAVVDLEFLAERPGRLKLLIRGNHDSWWTSASKVRRLLPAGLAILSNDAMRLEEGIVVCGARGWTLPNMPWYEAEADERIYRRELRRLELSLSHAAALRERGDVLIAMLHFPPLGPGERRSAVIDRLAAAGVGLAVYGHLHGAEDHAWAPRGEFEGVRLVFVAADFVDFAPVPVLERPAQRPAAGPNRAR